MPNQSKFIVIQRNLQPLSVYPWHLRLERIAVLGFKNVHLWNDVLPLRGMVGCRVQFSGRIHIHFLSFRLLSFTGFSPRSHQSFSAWPLRFSVVSPSKRRLYTRL